MGSTRVEYTTYYRLPAVTLDGSLLGGLNRYFYRAAALSELTSEGFGFIKASVLARVLTALLLPAIRSEPSSINWTASHFVALLIILVKSLCGVHRQQGIYMRRQHHLITFGPGDAKLYRVSTEISIVGWG